MYTKALLILISGKSTTLKRALVAATYTRAGGLFYGGHELAASHRELIKYMETRHAELLKNVTRLCLLDVHTGLGPRGQDTLLVDHGSLDDAERLFGKGAGSTPAPYQTQLLSGSAGAGGAGDGYEDTRGITLSCYPRLFKAVEWSLSMAQEFGTVSGAQVLMTMAEENMAFHSGVPMGPYGQMIYEVFAPRSQSFYSETLARGLLLLTQAQAI